MCTTHTLQQGEEGRGVEGRGRGKSERCVRHTGTVWRCKTNNNNKVESCGGLREQRRALICAPSKVKISLCLTCWLPISRAPSRFDVLFWITLREIDLADFFYTLRYTEKRNSRAGYKLLQSRGRGGGDCENRSRILLNLRPREGGRDSSLFWSINPVFLILHLIDRGKKSFRYEFDPISNSLNRGFLWNDDNARFVFFLESIFFENFYSCCVEIEGINK